MTQKFPMRISRDLLIVVILFVVLIGLTGLAASLRKPESEELSRVAYSTHNVEANGAQALQRWLEALGYRTHQIEGETFNIPNDARVLFILNQSFYSDARDADAVMNWVARGNTLIVADTGNIASSNALTRALEQGADRFIPERVEQTTLEQPILNSPSPAIVQTRTRLGLKLERADYVPYLSAQGSPLLVWFKRGRGQVWLCSAPYLFTNDGLRDETNAALVSALAGNAPRDSVIAFDEYHLQFHRPASADERNLQTLLYTTPWGWAILYALVIAFTYLAINGQRLGRVLALPQTLARRSPAEYVVSMAQLFRRAGKRQIAQKHYYQHLKRKLAHPYRINPDLPDDEFIATLARHTERIDRDALARTLRALNQNQVGERALVKLAHHAIKFTQRRG